jgi:acyl transferase domain-containing protein/acyl carrier protein
MTQHSSREARTAMDKDVAIIGMAGVFPKAPDAQTFWHNILAKVDGIVDPPEESLISQVYDPQSTATNRIYCKRGGYIDALPLFRPDAFGIMPVAVDGAEPEHFIALQVAADALRDAGIPDLPLNRERTEVLIGRGTFVNRGYMTAMQHSVTIDQTIRLLGELLPQLSEQERETIRVKLHQQLPPFSPETAPGLCHNVMAGLIANRLDLKGRNLVIDAACASCLLAVEIAIADLLQDRCDAVVVGAVQVSTQAPLHMIFTHLGALSRSAHLRPFDRQADGTMLGEGIGMMVLKRKEDALRDGHRIYALIKGVGSSSDGKGKGLLAPNVDGEELALRRAYADAGIDPATVELLEAHGTGIPLGDLTEFQALRRVFVPREPNVNRCGVGSVKSMIGHLIPAAGVAGLIKTAYALYHKTLPPTIACDEVNPAFELETTPLYINTEARAWIHGAPSYPRRAGVSAFGFGGINAHVVLEEYPANQQLPAPASVRWPTELFVFAGAARGELIAQCRQMLALLPRARQKGWSLADLAFSLNVEFAGQPCRLAIIAASLDELERKIHYAVERLQDESRERIKERSGVYFFARPLAGEGKLAFLFPGEGSQYVNMLADLCLSFPEARACFDLLDRAYAGHPQGTLPSHFIFPPTAEQKARSEQAIFAMEGAVDAVSTANRALYKLFTALQIHPDAIVGHSSGELVALEASGAVVLEDEEEVLRHIQVGHSIIASLQQTDTIPEGQLLAVGGVNATVIHEVIQESAEFLCLAMENCPHQFVLCGTGPSIEQAVPKLQQHGAICQPLPFHRPYHTDRFAPALDVLQQLFSRARFAAPQVPLYSCMTAALFPDEPQAVMGYARDQWAKRVQFRQTVEQMYADGVRLFVEIGPRANLTGFVSDTLKGRNVLAVAANVHHRPAMTQLQHALAQLVTHGVSMDLMALYRHRPNTNLHLFADHKEEQRGTAKRHGMVLSRDLPLLSLQGEHLPSCLAEPRNPPPAACAVDTPNDPLQPGTEVNLSPQRENQEDDEMTDKVMLEYLKTMENFLKMQENIMRTYLSQGGAQDGRPVLEDLPPVAEIPSMAVAPSVTATSPTPIMADVAPVPPPRNDGAEPRTVAAPQVPSAPAAKNVRHLLLALVSEKTGYPEEMLDMNVNIEADLGIDSIKRVEILGALTKQLGLANTFTSEHLTGVHTLAEIVSFFEQQRAKASEGGEGSEKKKSP